MTYSAEVARHAPFGICTLSGYGFSLCTQRSWGNVAEQINEQGIDWDGNECTFYSNYELLKGEAEVCIVLLVLRVVHNAIEHHVSEHRGEEEGERTRQTLDPGEGLLRGAYKDAQPEVVVPEVLQIETDAHRTSGMYTVQNTLKGTPSIPQTYLSSSVAWGLNLKVG